MKKYLLFLMILSVFLFSTSQGFAAGLILSYDGLIHEYTGSIYSLKVDGELVDTDIPPVIINNRTLVPVRGVFEKLGATVEWDGEKKKVNVVGNGANIELKVNDPKALVNNTAVTLDVPAKIINGRTMVPIRFISEQLQMQVGWYPEEKLITVAKTGNQGTGTIKDVKYFEDKSNYTVNILMTHYTTYKVSTLTNPFRIIIDIPNTEVPELPKKIEVKGKLVSSIRYAQFEGKTARVVIDLTKQSKYNIVKKESQLVVNIPIPLPLTKPTALPATAKPTPVKPTATVAQPTPTTTPESTATVTPQAATPSPQPTPSPQTVSRGEGDRDLPGEDNKASIRYYSVDGVEKVIVSARQYYNYKIARYTDPNRIVLDLPNTSVDTTSPDEQEKIAVNSQNIKTIRYAKFDKTSVRVVVDVTGQPQYNLVEENGELVINISTPTYKNITYLNNGDRVYFSLQGAKLTTGGESLKKFYTEQVGEDGKTYIIRFPSSLADIGSGTMLINDSLLESVVIDSISSPGETTIEFRGKSPLVYNVYNREEQGNTNITVLKQAAWEDRLVVIDPGHGGSDPGANYGDLLEKTLNLDISLRLNALLKAMGVKTYMTREDDTFLGLYERAYIANNLNATLFLSVHNNAYTSSTKGTETLYYPGRANTKGFSSKRFATLLQKEMLEHLGTYDRGLVERPGLVVLKATNMPAALAEVAFITNKTDRANLMSEDFRQKAAQALCDAIIQALQEV